MSLRHWIYRLSGERLLPPRLVVAVLRLEGVIAARGGLGRRSLSLPGLADQIERAFALDGLKAVALAINSPGGSPAQSALIAGRIRQFAAEKNVPVLAFAEDVAASGGYWLALAGDEIFATEGSILGSIGVISTASDQSAIDPASAVTSPSLTTSKGMLPQAAFNSRKRFRTRSKAASGTPRKSEATFTRLFT